MKGVAAMKPAAHVRSVVAALVGAALLAAAAGRAEEKPKPTPLPADFGRIERLDPRLDKLVPKDARLEKLGEGFKWSEGPVWLPDEKCLLFSDIPRNAVMQWKEGEGVRVFLKPSGYTGEDPRRGESGSNGLLLDAQGRLILCQHGDRRVARWEKGKGFTTLADRYRGKRFNSPNDAVLKSNGDLYFTDPPYGLEKGPKDPNRELDFCGVYRRSADGQVTLLTREMTRPNGIGFSPDEKTLYVAQSDPNRAICMAFPVQDDGMLGQGRVFFDATPWVKQGLKGLPDGLKVDRQGNVFATGPGGVNVFAPDGTHLGRIRTGVATANCAFGDGSSTLYITAHMFLARIKTSTRGLGY